MTTVRMSAISGVASRSATVRICSSGVETARAKTIKRSGSHTSRSTPRVRPKGSGRLADRGVAVLQCYGTADLGLVAYESPAREGMIVDEGVIVEIVRPGTGDPVPDGEPGEVVVTSFNRDYPLLRFATGDISAILAGASPCGRSAGRGECQGPPRSSHSTRT